MLARASPRDVHFFDLESPSDLARLANPELILSPLKGLVILDEVQRRPDLFPLLRVLADRPDAPARFLILGSASPELLKAVSESLAGRVSFIDVTGFSLTETGVQSLSRLWWRDGFPKAFLASSDRHAYFWGTHSGAELDLLLSHNGRRLGVEFKFTDRPATTKSMRVVQQDLMLDHLYVVHPGEHTFALDTAITAVTLPQLTAILLATN